MTPRRVLLAWSSGKDSAWALHLLRGEPGVEVVGLLTTLDGAAGRVATHGVHRMLVEAQAAAAGLPVRWVELPWPCPNAAYEERTAAAIGQARRDGVTHVAFGDLHLADIRDYRVRQLAGSGVEPLFPLWGPAAETPALARRMLAAGLRCVLTCVDPARLPAAFAGRDYGAALLADLPPGVDPCGEFGEFHTFCYAGPMFAAPLAVRVGATAPRDGFWFADVALAGPPGSATGAG